MRRLTLVALAVYLTVSAAAITARQAAPGAAPAAAAAGVSVWDGVFTTAQADRGRTLFNANCAECHGPTMQGGEGKPLAGEVFWNDWREQTVGDLLTYVSRNMPFSEDGSLAGTLAPSTYLDIVTHILRTNALPAGAQELTAASSASAKIIARGGSGELPPSTLAHVVGCLAPRGADGSWRLLKGSSPTRVTAGGTVNKQAPLGEREYALKFVLRNLTTFVGHRMSVTGLLLGNGGVDGLNVSTVDSVAPACD